MFYYLFGPFADKSAFFNLFQYTSFRGGAALFTAFLLCFFLGKPIIRWLKSKQGEGQPIRDDGPESHLLTKKGTPTMGGVMILLSVLISTLLWADLSNSYIWVILLVTTGFGLLGFFDDYLKLTQRNTKGLPPKLKFLGQLTISLAASLWIMYLAAPDHKTHISIPFFKDVLINLWWFYIIFTICVMVGASNAVNLTDGLDGLAIVPVIIAVGAFGIIAYIVGDSRFSEYLYIIHVPGTAQISVIAGAVIGSGLGFLWYNAPPAQVFMGDTGSLALGGLLGTISVITKHEIVLSIIGGLFVVETLSVMLQVFYYKRTGKRIFLMAPIHHHFEKKGWSESTIVIRFWIIALLCAMIGLATLKLR